MPHAADPRVQAIIDRFAAIDWRKPGYDKGRILDAYQRWQYTLGIGQPIRLATDPTEAGLWTSNASTDHLALAPSSDSWVPRFWVEMLSGQMAPHRTIASLYREAGISSDVAVPPLPIEWNVATAWASLLFWSDPSADHSWMEASMRAVAARNPAILRVFSLIFALGPLGPWGPPSCLTLALRDSMIACRDAACWKMLTQFSASQSDQLAKQLDIPIQALGPMHRDEIVDSLITFCEPMLTACESGAFAHVVLNGELIVVISPSIWTDGRRLHRADGPAVAWRQTKVHAWKGVFVPEQFAMHPQAITLDAIRAMPDERLQHTLIDIYAHTYGHRRCMQEFGGSMVHEDAAGRLWCMNPMHPPAPQPGDLRLLEVTNGTPEPDGSRKTYWLRVPPNMQTAMEAVAWTYGMTPDEYRGLVVRT